MASAAAAAGGDRRIVRMDDATANRICSGQVITQLATAVKELVENALDAHASTVEVRLREFGAEAVEVVDNGSGIAAADFAALTRKSATSKIRDFDDVTGVASFGFRGEALAALCEVSGSFTVVTRTADEPVGHRLVYDRAGRLVSDAPAARAVGTTVTLTDLFAPLPVRRKDFLKTLARHYDGLLRALEAYALRAVGGKRLLVSNLVTGSAGLGRGGGGGGASKPATAKGAAASAAGGGGVGASWGAAKGGSSGKAAAAAAADRSGSSSASAAAASSSAAGADSDGDDDDGDAALPSVTAPKGTRQTVLKTTGKGGAGAAGGSSSSSAPAAAAHSDVDALLAGLRDNIVDVFGGKFADTLVAVDIPLSDELFPLPRGGGGARRQSGGAVSSAVAMGGDGDGDGESAASAAAAAAAPGATAADTSASSSASGSGSSSSSFMISPTAPQPPLPPSEEVAYGGGEGGGVVTMADDDRGANDDGEGAAAAADTAALVAPVPAAARQRIVGFVSKAGTGVGRANTAKQFLFLNGRPVDVPSLSKTLQEVWRCYEMGHRPAYVLDLQLRSGAFDVNVSPDKREVILVGQAAVTDALKAGLHALWEPSRRTFAVAPLVVTEPGGGPLAASTGMGAAAASRRDAGGAASAGSSSSGDSSAAGTRLGGAPPLAPTSADSGRTAGSALAVGTPSVAALMAASSLTSADASLASVKQAYRRQLHAAGGGVAGEEEEGAGLRPPPGSGSASAASALSSISFPSATSSVGDVAALASAAGAGGSRAAAAVAASSSSIAGDDEDTEHEDDDEEDVGDTGGDNSATAAAANATVTTSGELDTNIGAAAGAPSPPTVSGAKRGRRGSEDDDSGRRPGKQPHLQQQTLHYSTQAAAAVASGKAPPSVRPLASMAATGSATESPPPSSPRQQSRTRSLLSAPAPPPLPSGTPERARKQREAVDVATIRAAYRTEAVDPAAAAPPTEAAVGASAEAAGPSQSLFSSHRHTTLTAAGAGAGGESSSATTPAAPTSSSSAAAIADAAVLSGAVSDVSLAACAAAGGGDLPSRLAVEATYSRVLTKAHFAAMAAGGIVGQFNKGFIVAGVPDAPGGGGSSDLFILDQHACDEKFLFETLQARAEVTLQQLLVPRPLSLSPAEEATVADHADIFNANGFHFEVNPGGPPGGRVALVAVPNVRGIAFGDEDVRELAAAIADAGLPPAPPPGTPLTEAQAAARRVRLPRWRAIWASRACRDAVMIGDALPHRVQARVVGQMAALEQPWNCPHGRPTLRHLVDLAQLRPPLAPAGPPHALTYAGLAGEEVEDDDDDDVVVDEANAAAAADGGGDA